MFLNKNFQNATLACAFLVKYGIVLPTNSLQHITFYLPLNLISLI